MNSYLYSPDYSIVPCTSMSAENFEVYAAYYRKYLMMRAISAAEWEFPEDWGGVTKMSDYFRYTLYIQGFCAVIFDWRVGWVPQRCALTGWNVVSQPTAVNAYNNILGTVERSIGDGAVLFVMNADYTGIADIVDNYARMLADARVTLRTSLVNSRVAYAFAVEGKKESQTVGKMIDDVIAGKVATITKNSQSIVPLDLFRTDVKNNYIVSDLLVDINKIIDMFDSEIGIPNANTEKRERMVKDEVNSNNIAVKSKLSQWIDGWRETCRELEKQAGSRLIWVSERSGEYDNATVESSES